MTQLVAGYIAGPSPAGFDSIADTVEFFGRYADAILEDDKRNKDTKWGSTYAR